MFISPLKILISFGLILLCLSYINTKPLDFYICGDVCTDEYEPYCVVFSNGTVAEFENECKLQLETCRHQYRFSKSRSGACNRNYGK